MAHVVGSPTFHLMADNLADSRLDIPMDQYTSHTLAGTPFKGSPKVDIRLTGYAHCEIVSILFRRLGALAMSCGWSISHHHCVNSLLLGYRVHTSLLRHRIPCTNQSHPLIALDHWPSISDSKICQEERWVVACSVPLLFGRDHCRRICIFSGLLQLIKGQNLSNSIAILNKLSLTVVYVGWSSSIKFD